MSDLVIIDEPQRSGLSDSGLWPNAKRSLQLVSIDLVAGNQNTALITYEEFVTPASLVYKPFSFKNPFRRLFDRGEIVYGKTESALYQVIGQLNCWSWFPSFKEMSKDYWGTEMRVFNRWYRKWDYERHNGGKCD